MALPGAVVSFVTLTPAAVLTPLAIGIACELGHAVYDCHYLALSLEVGERLATADHKLVTACRGTRFEGLAMALGRLR